MKIDLFSDLDHTLIYSRRDVPDQETLVVEMLNGMEQSYMTRRTFQFLKHASDVRLIPVTTRTREQFQRITLFSDALPCPYALVCNGGELLVHGEPDRQWMDETREIAARSLAELPFAAEVMKALLPEGRIHIPSGLMVYAAADNPIVIARQLRRKVDTQLLNILCDRRKIYCIPTAINKGAAVSRFMARYPTETIVTAGDSVFDIPMLIFGDFAVAKRSIADAVHHKNKFVVADDVILSDEICSFLERITNYGSIVKS